MKAKTISKLAPLYKCVQKYVYHTTKVGSRKENEVAGFVVLFTVAFLLILAHAGGSNPTGQSLTFT